jgi:hypothetical protein
MGIDSEENGTCATIWSLWHAEIKNMQVADLTKSLHNALPLSIDDILHNPIKTAILNKYLVHSICRMIVTHGADSFKKFQKDMKSNQLRINQLIEVHKTSHHPLPAWNIDQSTIVSNAEVAEVIFDELGVLESTQLVDNNSYYTLLRALKPIMRCQIDIVPSYFGLRHRWL